MVDKIEMNKVQSEIISQNEIDPSNINNLEVD